MEGKETPDRSRMISLTHLTDELFHVMIESLNREPLGRDVRREHSRLTCDFLPHMMVVSHYLPSGMEKTYLRCPDSLEQNAGADSMPVPVST